MCSRCTDCCTLCAARGISCRHARCADHCTLQSASCICYRDAFLELAGYHISIFPFQRAFHPFCTPLHSTYSSNREPLAFADTSLHADGTHAMLVHTSGGICEPIVKAGGVPCSSEHVASLYNLISKRWALLGGVQAGGIYALCGYVRQFEIDGMLTVCVLHVASSKYGHIPCQTLCEKRVELLVNFTQQFQSAGSSHMGVQHVLCSTLKTNLVAFLYYVQDAAEDEL